MLDIDSQQIGSVTYVAGVGAKLVGDKISEVWEVGEVGKNEKQILEIHLHPDKDFGFNSV